MAGQARYFAADTEYQVELTRRRIAEAGATSPSTTSSAGAP